jgi:inositol-phosphate transport system permease protein
MNYRRLFVKPLPYLFLVVISSPIIIGYIWVLIRSFTRGMYGMKPVGGYTVNHWIQILGDPILWNLALNTFILALGLTIGILLVSTLAAYPLSRMAFKGRRYYLSLSLILHAFPSVTLLIAIFFVLRWISRIPVIGRGLPIIGGFGYNTIGGVLLVSVAFMLPLGIWLMKGFFDNISWDIERAALIDGCSRFRTWRQILLPQIRPGLAALGIFAFMHGWSSFIIPYTFMVDARTAVMSTYLNMLTSGDRPIDYGVASAVALFQLLPILFFYLFTQKYLLKIFSGGMKGGS